jgi:fibro-slime domain-containing protein
MALGGGYMAERMSVALAALASLALGGCGSSTNGSGGNGTGGDNGLIFNAPDGGKLNGQGGGGSTAFSTTLPPGFTKADVGGWKLGDPITGTGSGAADGGTSAGGCGTKLLAVTRDFRADGVNFEGVIADDRNLVKGTLGTDEKPVFAQPGPTQTTAGPAAFAQWYRNVSGVNSPYVVYLWFQPKGGVLTFHSSAFFPLDGKGFGNQGNAHNFHFTTEVHTQFQYKGGETFHFTGDDDLWVFVNHKLAIDLGGVHGAETAQIDLDAQASAFGITKGTVYDLDLFHAERHTTQSNFQIETDLSFVNCGSIVPEIR